MKTDWNPILRPEFAKPYWQELQRFVAAEREQGTVYPPHDEVFAALHLTPYAEVKVLILGQDPYHGPNQAHGLCFSVRSGVVKPPSLVNIFAELEADLGHKPPSHGSLQDWARQGVLLLNTALTVRAHVAASHAGKGWETFTDEVIRAVNDKADRVVFILWGAHARKKKALIDSSPPRDHRVGASVAVVRPQRLLRVPPVQPGQRRAGRSRANPRGLANRLARLARVEHQLGAAEQRQRAPGGRSGDRGVPHLGGTPAVGQRGGGDDVSLAHRAQKVRLQLHRGEPAGAVGQRGETAEPRCGVGQSDQGCGVQVAVAGEEPVLHFQPGDRVTRADAVECHAH